MALYPHEQTKLVVDLGGKPVEPNTQFAPLPQPEQ
jgi:hypothetical protein